jgi:hypothetical protein
MDHLKDALRKKVKDLLKSELEIYSDFNGVTIEVQDIAPGEVMLRAKSLRRSGAPRYFRVKISEVM